MFVVVYGWFYVILVVLSGFHCLWWFSAVFIICGGFGWFLVLVVGLGGFQCYWLVWVVLNVNGGSGCFQWFWWFGVREMSPYMRDL